MPTVPSESEKTGARQSRRNARVALICLLVFGGMIGAAYASVPLYKRFCQLTGFGGTVRQAEAAPTKVLERPITIRFDTNVRDLPWSFKAEQISQTLKIGSTGLAFFKETQGTQEITLSYTFFQDVKSVGKQAGLQVAPGNGSKALGVKPSAGL